MTSQVQIDALQQRNMCFEVSSQTYFLRRYPEQTDKTLKAWDAADEYLLSTVLPELKPGLRILIVNDNFGALTVPLMTYQPECYGDSWQSREALCNNLAINEIEQRPLFFERLVDLSRTDERYDLVVGRIPKSKDQLRALLVTLRALMKPQGQLFLAGMDKHLSKGQLDLVSQYFGHLNYLPGRKKARIWSATVNTALDSTAPVLSEVTLPDYQLTLCAGPNLFSRDSLDIGSRFFLEHFTRLPKAERVADLACGNGVLGLAYLRIHPTSQMLFCDESFDATESTRMNLERNFDDVSAQVFAGDGLKGAEPDSLDLILCNPPFHQQNTVSTDIAKRFFRDAKRCLHSGGELWVIANRHLAYHVSLRKLFGDCTVQASNHKFVVLRALKA